MDQIECEACQQMLKSQGYDPARAFEAMEEAVLQGEKKQEEQKKEEQERKSRRTKKRRKTSGSKAENADDDAEEEEEAEGPATLDAIQAMASRVNVRSCQAMLPRTRLDRSSPP